MHYADKQSSLQPNVIQSNSNSCVLNHNYLEKWKMQHIHKNIGLQGLITDFIVNCTENMVLCIYVSGFS